MSRTQLRRARSVCAKQRNAIDGGVREHVQRVREQRRGVGNDRTSEFGHEHAGIDK